MIKDKEKVLTVIDSKGMPRTFKLAKDEKTKLLFKDIFVYLGVWDKEEIQQEVEHFNWRNIERCLLDSGFPVPLDTDRCIIDIEEDLNIESL